MCVRCWLCVPQGGTGGGRGNAATLEATLAEVEGVQSSSKQ